MTLFAPVDGLGQNDPMGYPPMILTDDNHVRVPCRITIAGEAVGGPDWIELIPEGERIEGRDGRVFFNPEAQSIVEAFNLAEVDLPIDYEHATEILAPLGQAAPAAGWIKTLEVRGDGGIWARVEWTDRGSNAISTKEYRYISPVFLTKDSEIRQLISAGLTNRPNLRLTALNRAGDMTATGPGGTMDGEQVKTALGLAEEASTEDVVREINAIKGKSVSLDEYVPRADYDVAMNRASTAEESIHRMEAEKSAEAICSALDEAVAAGKIAPASRNTYEFLCKAEGGLAKFQEFVDSAPAIVNAEVPKVSGLETNGNSLSDDEKMICNRLRIDEAAYISEGRV